MYVDYKLSKELRHKLKHNIYAVIPIKRVIEQRRTTNGIILKACMH